VTPLGKLESRAHNLVELQRRLIHRKQRTKRNTPGQSS
jgi:hypothetical protein